MTTIDYLPGKQIRVKEDYSEIINGLKKAPFDSKTTFISVTETIGRKGPEKKVLLNVNHIIAIYDPHTEYDPTSKETPPVIK